MKARKQQKHFQGMHFLKMMMRILALLHYRLLNSNLYHCLPIPHHYESHSLSQKSIVDDLMQFRHLNQKHTSQQNLEIYQD